MYIHPLPLTLTISICFSNSTRGKYGEGAKQEKFRYALSLVFIQCVINAIFSKLCKYSQRHLKGTCAKPLNFPVNLFWNSQAHSKILHKKELLGSNYG